MNRLKALATAVLGVMFVWCSYADEIKTFTVTGEWIVTGSGTTGEQLEAIRDQDPTVEITGCLVDDDGTSYEYIVASSSFNDGKVLLTGEIEARTSVVISVSRGKEAPMKLSAVLIPGTRTSFALWDRDNSFPGVEDQLLLVEDFRIVEESDAKFTISGDLSSIDDKDLSLAVAYIGVGSSNPKEGSVLSKRSNQVFLKDGRFSIEGVATEPILVDVWIHSQVDVYSGVVSVVVEPGAKIRISPSKSSSSFAPGGRASELLAHSEKEGSYHSKVIESWQNSEEYLRKMDVYAHAIEIAAQKTTADAKTEDESTKDEVVAEQITKTPYDAFKEMAAIKNSVLTSLAQNSEDDPTVALLAMELGVRSGVAYARQLESWDKVAATLDKDIVDRRVVPQRDSRARQIKVAANAKTIVAGQKAPEFTLADLEGEDVALYDVLAENEVVLIDFWASWCGPCIAKLPKLRELHAEYSEKGFEIVFVSIDDTYEDWKAGSDAHQVPGINVGDLNGFLGDTPVDYGITWIPTEFFLESDGEILNRELSTDELKQLLDDRFGSKSEEKETEDPSVDGEVL